MTENVHTTKKDLEAIRQRLNATMREIADRADAGGDEEALERELERERYIAVWRGLELIASHLDYLRASSVQGPWVGKGQENPPPTYNT